MSITNSIASIVRAQKRKIVYNVLRTNNGWQVQAFMPKGVSGDDRILVLDWFHQYRAEVHRRHPLWITTFNPAERAYVLDIVQASSSKDFIVKATTTSPYNPPVQLAFDYAI